MSATPQILLTHHLKTLKLPTFLSEYDKEARQCAQEGVAHTGYLLRLAELEIHRDSAQNWRIHARDALLEKEQGARHGRVIRLAQLLRVPRP